MPVKGVIMLGDPLLRKKCRDAEAGGCADIIRDLKDTLMYLQIKKDIGRALAAPQIGCLKKCIYCRTPGREIVMVNPEIIEKSDELFEVWDSCFSFDVAFFVKIPRHKKIKVRYFDALDNPTVEVFSDEFSELFQHEIDHLHGVLAVDHLKDPKNIMMRSEWKKRIKKR